MSVQDSAAAEEVEQVTQPDTVASDSATNLLSSGSFLILNNISLDSAKCTILSYFSSNFYLCPNFTSDHRHYFFYILHGEAV